MTTVFEFAKHPHLILDRQIRLLEARVAQGDPPVVIGLFSRVARDEYWERWRRRDEAKRKKELRRRQTILRPETGLLDDEEAINRAWRVRQDRIAEERRQKQIQSHHSPEVQKKCADAIEEMGRRAFGRPRDDQCRSMRGERVAQVGHWAGLQFLGVPDESEDETELVFTEEEFEQELLLRA